MAKLRKDDPYEDDPPKYEQAEFQDLLFPGYIEFFIENFGTDPVQYKPYSPHFTPVDPVAVRIPVEAKEHVIEYDPIDGITVLNLDGFMCVLRTVANAIETMHSERQDDLRDRYNKRR